MANENHDRTKKYIRWAVVILGVVLVALIVFVVAEYRVLKWEQIIDAHEMHISELLARHAPLPVTDAGIVRSWMTFDYVNRLFALPPEYLKTSLQISDTHYPRITIGKSLGTVEEAIRKYVAPNSATSTGR